MTRLIPLVILIALTLQGCGGQVGEPGGPAGGQASVVHVIDGDSLILDTPSGQVELRLSGVNAPERGECHHTEAGARLAALVETADLTLEIEGTDRFGRALGRLRADRSDLALVLVREGHGLAVATASGSNDLLSAEDAAHAEGLGMWAAGGCGSGRLPLLEFDPGASVVDPPGRDQEVLGAEKVTIVNRDQQAVDLTGWMLRDGSSRHRYAFDPGTLLRAGNRIEIASADPGWSPGGSPVWSNQGDIALLLDPLGRVVARWRYDG